jgi:hypothetical protein
MAYLVYLLFIIDRMESLKMVWVEKTKKLLTSSERWNQSIPGFSREKRLVRRTKRLRWMHSSSPIAQLSV